MKTLAKTEQKPNTPPLEKALDGLEEIKILLLELTDQYKTFSIMFDLMAGEPTLAASTMDGLASIFNNLGKTLSRDTDEFFENFQTIKNYFQKRIE